ncbi:hypothetical protein AB6A40_004156 [Gnathostoma spinigerum]|uniref:Uncharacterized protein n=1 Tax=Gnathostoma spinigerum TaxID=75299 RepID=A0ABD6EL63_9BILA
MKCTKCHTKSTFNLSTLQDLVKTLEFAIREIDEKSCESIENVKTIYYEAEKVFTSLNIRLCQLADRIVTWAVDHQDFRTAAEFIEKTFPCFEHVYPGEYPSLSLQYFKAGKLHALNDSTLELAAQRLEMAVKSLRVSHGIKHHLHEEANQLLLHVEQQRRELLARGYYN